MSKTVWVIDTETSTTTFDPVPDGHIVELGAVKVNLNAEKIERCYGAVVLDPLADRNAWVFRNTSLTYDTMMLGVRPSNLDRYISELIGNDEATAYNISFDKTMIERDLPLLASRINWGRCLMKASSRVPEIPRRHGGMNKYPTAEASYNYLCPDDPCRLNGHELHRAVEDARMEAHILISLYKAGIWTPKEVCGCR